MFVEERETNEEKGGKKVEQGEEVAAGRDKCKKNREKVRIKAEVGTNTVRKERA